MRYTLDAESSLIAVGWLYTAGGVWAAVESIVGLFAPLGQPSIWLQVFISDLNLAVLLLPLGIGLLRQSSLCRLMAVVLSWSIAGMVATVGLLLAVTSIFEVKSLQWHSIPGMSTGDVISCSVTALLIGLPLFIWQLRVLTSRAVRQLTGKHRRIGAGDN